MIFSLNILNKFLLLHSCSIHKSKYATAIDSNGWRPYSLFLNRYESFAFKENHTNFFF